MLQLSDRNTERFASPLIDGEHDIVVQNRRRKCTDIVCFILFLLFLGAFVGLLIYGISSGSPRKVFGVYNSDEVRCESTTDTKYGYFTTQGSLNNAICVNQCPTSSQQVLVCKTDSVKCLTGTFIATYATFTFDYFCVPSVSINGQDISQFLNYNIFSAWAFDLRQGWMILVGAAVASMLASLLFLLVVRCCTGIIIWLSIIIVIGGLQVIGIFFILEAKGISIGSIISEHLSTLSYNTLIIVGSGCIAAGVLFLLLVICLRSRITLGGKAVQLGAIFLFENCCMIILPITQACFVAGTIAAIIAGGIYLYSLGSFTFPNDIAFPVVELQSDIIIMISFFLAGGIWVMFFFHGCNHFMLCSAVSVWYFNYESNHDLGSPFCDSLDRLIRFHPGSVAITALVNGLFFIIKVLAHLFSFEAKAEDHKCTAICLKCLNLLFCAFNCLLRFLNDGAYVQMAVFGKGYCRSTLAAFSIIADNAGKISITDGISIFFTIIGILGISVGVSVAAYFTIVQVSYLATLQTNPIILTVTSGLIAFIISAIYLSMIDLSSMSILQCYFIDQQHHHGKLKYAQPQFREIIMIEN